jgi:hypothetical protein
MVGISERTSIDGDVACFLDVHCTRVEVSVTVIANVPGGAIEEADMVGGQINSDANAACEIVWTAKILNRQTVNDNVIVASRSDSIEMLLDRGGAEVEHGWRMTTTLPDRYPCRWLTPVREPDAATAGSPAFDDVTAVEGGCIEIVDTPRVRVGPCMLCARLREVTVVGGGCDGGWTGILPKDQS